MSSILVRVSHRLSAIDWENMHEMMDDVYKKALISEAVFGVRSPNELPFIEHALDIELDVNIRVSSFDQVVALSPHSMRLLKLINHPRSGLSYWRDTDQRTSQMRWEMMHCDKLLVVRHADDWQLYANDVDLALELEMTAVAVDLTSQRMTRLSREIPAQAQITHSRLAQ
jgi:hypothetical protein